LKVCAVKGPGFGDRRTEMLKDIAILTGGKFISEDLGIKLENVTLDMLGTAKKIVIDKENTTIVDGAGNSEDIEARASQIKVQIENTDSDYDKEKLRERFAKLSGGVAVVKVGGATEVEVKEKRDRVEDALNATQAAVQEGIVIGGGAALLKSVSVLKNLSGKNSDQDVGISIVAKALVAPAKQIAENSGEDGSLVNGRLLDNYADEYGFDAQNGKMVNMFDAGIVDPTLVVRSALQDAASIAGLMITTEAMIADIPENNKDQGSPNPGMMM